MEQAYISSPWALPVITGGMLVVLGAIAFLLTTAVYKHIICLKYLFSGWKAVVPIVSALPAALGVFLLVLVFAIMDGFANETREMTRGTLSDIIVDAHLEGMPYYGDYISRIRHIEGVEAATPVIQTFALACIQPHRQDVPGAQVVYKPVSKPCQLIGIQPDEKAEMGRFAQYLGRGALLRKLHGEIDAALERFAAGPPSADSRKVWEDTLEELLEDINTARQSALVRPNEAAPPMDSVLECIAYLDHGQAPPDTALRQAPEDLKSLRQRLLAHQAEPVPVLGLPAWFPQPAGPPRPGCIVGTGLIGTPREMTKIDWVQEGVGRRVLAAMAAIVLVIVFLVLRRAARRRPGSTGWLVAVIVSAALAVSALAATVLLPVRTVEVKRDQVIDWPLIDYGDSLPVTTIGIRPSGALDVGVGGVANVNTRSFALVNTFKSGYWEADSTHVYVDFKVAQQMAGMDGQPAVGDKPAVPARASQIQVKIKDPAQARVVLEKLREAWGDLARERPDIGLMHLSFNTWEDQQKMILTVVEVEKNVTVLMLGLMFLGFGVLIALISYVMAYIKSRDVGILKAVGARDAGVGSLFLGYGFIIGLAGMAVGMVAALLVIQNLDAIEIWVNHTLHIDVFPREMYYFEHIPRNLSTLWCVGVGASVLVLSTLASLAGGLLAALRQPVETLRYE